MRASVFYGKHDLRVEEMKKPEIGPEEILVEIKACGVCGTDVHIYEGDKGAAQTHPPCVLGHEFAGIVAEAGERVRGLAVGDRVCVDPNRTCNECYYCKEGTVHYCENMIGYGTNTDGGFAEYCKVHYKQAYRIPEDVSFPAAAMAEPLSCCIHGIDLCHIRPGDTVLVIGGGMIGLLMVQLSKISGADTVILVEPVEEKREQGIQLGADFALDPFREDVKEALKEKGVERIQVVIECCGLPSTIEQALDLVGNKGTVMMFGLTKPEETVEIKPFSVFQKETTIRASYINPCTMGRAVRLISSGKIQVTSMLAGILSLEQLEEVLRDPVLRTKGKYIVDPGMQN